VSMSSALLSLLVSSGEIQRHVMFIFLGPHVRHFSDGNQAVCPTLKNASWPSVMPKQSERCLVF
jgi:hypothetical protein